jgi:hypothetical protein
VEALLKAARQAVGGPFEVLQFEPDFLAAMRDDSRAGHGK